MPEDQSQSEALRVGLFGIGLAAYWPQFDGLQERLTDALERVGARMARPGIEVSTSA